MEVVEKKKRTSIGMTPEHLIALSRLCIDIRELGGDGGKQVVIGKMITFFEKNRQKIKQLL